VSAGLLATFPTGRYLLRGAWEEARILAARRSILSMVSDSTVPLEVRTRLRLVLDARRFAVEQLGLVAGESFTTYAPVRHDTLVLVLSAAYRDRLEPLEWWFPIVGRVPYKGFFDFVAARRERLALERRGFDTVLGASSAFSTLGWFNDPLLSTTLHHDTLDLANTVTHELLHNTVFLKGQVEFNESFASFVGARGAAAFFRSRGADAAAVRVEREWEGDKRLSVFWRALAHTIDSAYARWPRDSAARVRARDSVYARARLTFVDSLAPLLPTVPRLRAEQIVLNNAVLLARRAYAHDLDLFEGVLQAEGGDLRRTIERIIGITRGANDPFAAIRAWLSERGVAARRAERHPWNRCCMSARRSSCPGCVRSSAAGVSSNLGTTRSIRSRTPRSMKRDS
jgi:predicted aminopeptidase